MDGQTGELCTAHSAMSSVREPPRKPSSLLHWDSTRCDRNLRHVGASVRVIGNADKGVRVREGEVRGRTRKRVYVRTRTRGWGEVG